MMGVTSVVTKAALSDTHLADSMVEMMAALRVGLWVDSKASRKVGSVGLKAAS